jgi:hypothetical protein
LWLTQLSDWLTKIWFQISKVERWCAVVEITYTVNGVEGSRNVRAASVDDAVAIFREDHGEEFIIIRTTGPWKVDA